MFSRASFFSQTFKASEQLVLLSTVYICIFFKLPTSLIPLNTKQAMGDKKGHKSSGHKSSGHKSKSSRTHVPIAPLPRKVAVPVGSKGQVWVPLNPAGASESMQYFEQDVSASDARYDAQASGGAASSSSGQQQQSADYGGNVDVSAVRMYMATAY